MNSLRCIAILAILSVSTYGWGWLGHEIVGEIAQNRLNPTAAARVVQLLPDFNGNLSLCAPWADSIKSNHNYDWAKPLHYINTPDWQCTFIPEVDCADGICVSSAIANYTKRLTNLSDETQLNEALKFLTHFVGDIHQPLHVGFKADKGGNSIKGKFFGYNDNLHAIWDTYMLYDIIDEYYGHDNAQFISHLMDMANGEWAELAKEWSADAIGAENDWGSESNKMACSHAYVYPDGEIHIESGFKLGQEYLDFNRLVVEQQLVKGGVRLAAILNAVFPDPSIAVE